jgi:hypothetical protein
MVTNSVMEKQSWTSKTEISSRGAVTPASA